MKTVCWLTHSNIRHDNNIYTCPLTDKGKKKIPDVQVILMFLPCSGNASEQGTEEDDCSDVPLTSELPRDICTPGTSLAMKQWSATPGAQHCSGSKFKTPLPLIYIPLALPKTRTLHPPDVIWCSLGLFNLMKSVQFEMITLTYSSCNYERVW